LSEGWQAGYGRYRKGQFFGVWAERPDTPENRDEAANADSHLGIWEKVVLWVCAISLVLGLWVTVMIALGVGAQW